MLNLLQLEQKLDWQENQGNPFWWHNLTGWGFVVFWLIIALFVFMR